MRMIHYVNYFQYQLLTMTTVYYSLVTHRSPANTGTSTMNKQNIALSAQAQQIYQQALICDNQLAFEHAIPVSFTEKWQLLERYKQAGFNCLNLSVGNDESTAQEILSYTASLLHHIKQNDKQYRLVQQPQDIIEAKKNNQLAIRLMLQGTSSLGTDLNNLDLYQKIGISSVILCYNIRNMLGDGCIELNDGGLSHFGVRFVERMNQLGMLIDCSHTGYKTAMHAMTLSTAPIIFSHSNAYAIHPHVRNLKDKTIKAVAKTNGLIGINSINALLGDPLASPEKYAEHVDYIAQLVGPQHVAIGLDFLYFPEKFNQFMQTQSLTHPTVYAEKAANMPQLKSMDPEALPLVISILMQKGYKEQHIYDLLGGNLMRVLNSLEK